MRARNRRCAARRRGREPGFALIELVVAIAIIAVLAVAFYGMWGRGGGDGEKKSLPEQAVDKAKSVDCQNMVRQVRMAIDMEKMETGTPPASIPSDTAPYAKCPQNGEPYVYDPRTGTVSCKTPGHEDY